MISAEELRRFFGIRYSENLGDILQQFTELLGFHVPEKVSTSKSKNEKQAIAYKMSQTGCEEPDKIYCYTVKRNPVIIDAKTGEMRQVKEPKKMTPKQECCAEHFMTDWERTNPSAFVTRMIQK